MNPTIKTSCFFLIALALLLPWQSLFAENSEFPGRDRFPDIPYIELDNLNARYDQVVIVDARSELEYNTLHIKDAINIPLSSSDFVERMKGLRSESKKTIVTYCNGKTCMKSFKAARKAKTSKVSDVIVFDAGIFDWTKKYPGKAVLLGKNPADPKSLLSKAQLKEHMIEPAAFGEKAHSGKGIVLDVRDNQQRINNRLFMGIEQHVSLSDIETLKKLIAKSNKKKKPLYIYDNTGKQVRWLMYQLEANNAKEYYFMKGGAHGYFKQLRSSYLTNINN